jgi:hypothetical protein
MTKYTHIRDHPLLETSLFVTMSYCTFLAAEAAQMTGELLNVPVAKAIGHRRSTFDVKMPNNVERCSM